MAHSKLDLLQGTLDVMVLQTLEVIGPAAWIRHCASHRTGKQQ